MSQQVYETESTTDREIVATRVFDAPRELVFDAWTDPKKIGQWWGPNGFTITTFEMDVKPGGVWRFIMHGPDGRDYQNKIVYAEVVRPERLVYDHVTGPLFHATVTFNEDRGKTAVTVRMVFETAELRDRVAKEHRAVEGLQQTLGRLGDYVSTSRDVTITRTFDAPRALMFSAWTDAKRLAQWWGPHGFTNPLCEIDARPGGAMRIDMRGPDGVVYPATGVVHDVVEPERIVFTITPLDNDGNALFEVLTTATFADENGRTKVTVNAHVVKTYAPIAAQMLAGMEAGWTQSLERLESWARSAR